MKAKKTRKNRVFNRDTDELIRAILQIENTSEAKKFFRDLLTEKEIEEFAQRWKVARMLYQKIPYVQIEKETGMSSTTIARVAKWLKSGASGYKLILKK